LKGTDNQSWICVGFIMLVSWSRLRVWKQMWIVKTQKDVMVSRKNDLWIMLHHKFICLLCVHHFSFFFCFFSLNIDNLFFFSSWCNQIIIIILFFVFFQIFLILMDFLLVNLLPNKSANHQCEVTFVQGNLKEKYLPF